MIGGNDAVGRAILAWPASLNVGDRVGSAGDAASDGAARDGQTILVSPSAETERQVFREWRASTCEFLILRVLRKEHADLKAELHHLRTLATASAEQHRGNRPEIIEELVQHLTEELVAHMDTEETTVFPALLEMELAYVGEASASTSSRGVGRLLKNMTEQHQRTRKTLAQLRRETHGFHPSSADSPLERDLYTRLASLDCGLRRDFTLENVVLFPRAVQMESELLRGAIRPRPA